MEKLRFEVISTWVKLYKVGRTVSEVFPHFGCSFFHLYDKMIQSCKSSSVQDTEISRDS